MGATLACQDAALCPADIPELMLTETEFILAADRTLAAIGEALDRALAASDADLDWNLVDGILEIECEDQSKLIVNRHTPNREIWLAARAGGSHFTAREGAWRDTRTGEELAHALAARLTEQSGLAVTFPSLVAPQGAS